jgi:hypothetical protein
MIQFNILRDVKMQKYFKSIGSTSLKLLEEAKEDANINLRALVL